MAQFLIQFPEIIDGVRGKKFGKWYTKFLTPSLDSALKVIRLMEGRCNQKLLPYRIMHKGKRVD